MIRNMLKRLMIWIVVGVLVLPGVVGASIPEPEKYDARVANYVSEGKIVNVTLDETSTSLTMFVLLGLAILGLAVMFKNAHRTHLD